jgi:hypothetical protein
VRDIVLFITPTTADDPPQFENELNIFNISEATANNVEVGTIQANDDMGKWQPISTVSANFMAPQQRWCRKGGGGRSPELLNFAGVPSSPDHFWNMYGPPSPLSTMSPRGRSRRFF